MADDLPYYSYNQFLQDTFGCRVYKVSIDAGFTCPNRDGTKGSGGCIFCDSTGSSSQTNDPSTPIREQVLNNIVVRKRRYRAQKFIVYFQSYTNTYALIDVLKKRYDEAVFAHPDIVGLSVSTRPDCVNEETIALIASYRQHLPYVCIEYGLQTIHNTTLQRINRCMKLEDFVYAMNITRKYDVDHCAHIILGLPGECREDQLSTARYLANEKINGVKIHTLVAIENTPLATMYRQGEWTPLSFEENISIAADFIKLLPQKTVIHRISGNGHPQHIVAPQWIRYKKNNIHQRIVNELINTTTP